MRTGSWKEGTCPEKGGSDQARAGRKTFQSKELKSVLALQGGDLGKGMGVGKSPEGLAQEPGQLDTVTSVAVSGGRVARLRLRDSPWLRCTVYEGFLKGSPDLQMSAWLGCPRV